MRGIWIFLTLLFASVPGTALAEKRVALVIGNSAYLHVPQLANPKNDAGSMSAKLNGLAFEVVTGQDLDLAGMRKSIRDFVSKLDGADIALFFYAGHGLQVNGSNYMAPVDAQLATYDDLDFEALPIELVLSAMERNAKVNLVFLDACRDNPLAATLARSMGTRSTTVGRGLAKLETGIGSLIAFATQPGNVALDGTAGNSPFTTALLKHVGTPGRSLTDELTDVRRAVLAATGGKQVPWESSSLTGPVFLNPQQTDPAEQQLSSAPANADSPDSANSVELAFWESIKGEQSKSYFETYVKRYPTGHFVDIARLKIAELDSRAEATGSAQPQSGLQPQLELEGSLGADGGPAQAQPSPKSGTMTSSSSEPNQRLAGLPPGAVSSEGDAAKVDFEKASRIASQRGWELYLAKHPSGTLSERALDELASVSYSDGNGTSPQEAERSLGLTQNQRQDVQSALTNLGYEIGPADGNFGAKTRREIARYQKAMGQTPTGFLDRSAVNRMQVVASPYVSVVSGAKARSFNLEDLRGLERRAGHLGNGMPER